MEADFYTKVFVHCLSEACDQFEYNSEPFDDLERPSLRTDLILNGHFKMIGGNPDFRYHHRSSRDSKISLPKTNLEFSTVPSKKDFLKVDIDKVLKFEVGKTQIFLLELDATVFKGPFVPKTTKLVIDPEQNNFELKFLTFEVDEKAHGFGMKFGFDPFEEFNFMIRSVLMRPYLDSVDVSVNMDTIRLEMTGNELVDQWQTSEVRILDQWLKFSTQGDRTGLNASLEYPKDVQIDWNNLKEIIHLSMAILEGRAYF